MEVVKFSQIIHGDCRKILKDIEDDSVNLIITSPPYNIGINYDSYDDIKLWNDYLIWCEEWLKECYRILKNDGKICINHYINFVDLKNKDRFPLFDIKSIQEKIGFKVSKLIILDERTKSTLTAWGSWLSASCPYIQTPIEGILISYKKQWKRLNQGISTIKKEEFIEAVSGVWNINGVRSDKTKVQFSEKIPRLCIQLLSYENDLIIDPFSGSGTTCKVAKKLGRRFIGIDISENYCKIAREDIGRIINDNLFE